MLLHGFKRSEYNSCVYIKIVDGSPIYLLLYVDDILIAAKSRIDITTLKKLLSSEFDMKNLGAAKKILGMKITRDRNSGLLFLSQQNYIKKVLQHFNMHDAKPASTSIASHFKLSAIQCASTDEDTEYMSRISYSSDVGSLMYTWFSLARIYPMLCVLLVDTCLALVKNIGMLFSGFSCTSETQQMLV